MKKSKGVQKTRRTGFTFPPEADLKEMREKLSDPNFEGTLALPADADEIDRAKYQICKLITGYKIEHDLLQRELAAKIGVDESRISEILNRRIKNFTLDRLIEYATKLHPDLKIEIRAA